MWRSLNYSYRNQSVRSVFRFSLLVAGALLTGGMVLGGISETADAQDRRIVTIEDADFFGGDYQTVKDVDLDGCKSACLSDNQCQAFTYNTSAGWCFLKSSAGQMQSFAGAVAGRVVEVQRSTFATTGERKAELDFLSRETLEAAETYLQRIEETVRPNSTDADEIRRNGSNALANNNNALAEADFLQLIALDPTRFDPWVQLSTALILQDPNDWQERETKRKNLVSAAINAYLRAGTPEDKSIAQEYLGRGN